jgi:hypothetical protein
LWVLGLAFLQSLHLHSPGLHSHLPALQEQPPGLQTHFFGASGTAASAFLSWAKTGTIKANATNKVAIFFMVSSFFGFRSDRVDGKSTRLFGRAPNSWQVYPSFPPYDNHLLGYPFNRSCLTDYSARGGLQADAPGWADARA